MFSKQSNWQKAVRARACQVSSYEWGKPVSMWLYDRSREDLEVAKARAKQELSIDALLQASGNGTPLRCF